MAGVVETPNPAEASWCDKPQTHEGGRAYSETDMRDQTKTADVALPATDANCGQQLLSAAMQASYANVQVSSEAVFETNRVAPIEGVEDVCTDSHEHQGDGGC